MFQKGINNTVNIIYINYDLLSDVHSLGASHSNKS